MKKIIKLGITLVCSFILVGCNSQKTPASSSKDTNLEKKTNSEETTKKESAVKKLTEEQDIEGIGKVSIVGIGYNEKLYDSDSEVKPFTFENDAHGTYDVYFNNCIIQKVVPSSEGSAYFNSTKTQYLVMFNNEIKNNSDNEIVYAPDTHQVFADSIESAPLIPFNPLTNYEGFESTAADLNGLAPHTVGTATLAFSLDKIPSKIIYDSSQYLIDRDEDMRQITEFEILTPKKAVEKLSF